jgi:two-component system, chemotaxis family, sensor kinase CheA
MSGLAEKFRRVAEERLARLSVSLVELEESAPKVDLASLGDLLRELHTLKGEAGVLGQKPLAALAHALEDLLGAAQRDEVKFDAELFDYALAGLDVMTAQVGGSGEDGVTADRFVGELRAFISDGGGGAAGGEPEATEQPPSDAERSSVPEMAEPTAASAGRVRYLRVDPERMSRLSELVGDLLVFRERGTGRSKRLKELFGQLRRTHGDQEWIPRLEELAREASQDAFLEFRRVRELGDRLRMLRLAPVRTLLEGYRRTARDLARTLQKDVRLEIEAQAVEVDQGVLEVLSEPLLHLVRNAVSHGIEDPSERVAAGKDPTGLIRLTVRQAGSHVEVVSQDDGAGVDPAAVAKRALARGLVTELEAETLSVERALELIFVPGFSTAGLSDISGRGIGLDVVRRRVEEHHGSVQVESVPGAGSRFTVRIPMDVAMAKALICEANGSHYAIATDAVVRVTEYVDGACRPLGGRPGFHVDGVTIPLCRLRTFLTAEPAEELRSGVPIVLTRARDRLVAIVPDSILGQRDVAYRPLDGFLSNLSAVQSSCLLSDGTVALLLNPVGLLANIQGDRAAVTRLAPTGPTSTKTVLVVEDSVITRDLIVEIVQAAGYSAVAAENGVDALEQLSLSRPHLVLTDLEMPRMDGIELTKRIRLTEQASGARLPIVVITTRASPEERRACLNAGADAFLDKAKFQEGRLLETIRRLIG